MTAPVTVPAELTLESTKNKLRSLVALLGVKMAKLMFEFILELDELGGVLL